MPTFPKTLFNKRIDTQIDLFFSEMKQYYENRGWVWSQVKREKDKWSNKDFLIQIKSKYSDGAYKVIEYNLNNLPSFYKTPESINDLQAISFSHILIIQLPREYPANLNKVKLMAKTPFYHPRISYGIVGRSNIRGICYVVKGELDRILNDLPFFLLLKKDRIRPPRYYKGEDYGLNRNAMVWYQNNIEKIVAFLDNLWDSKHLKRATQVTKKAGIVILDDN